MFSVLFDSDVAMNTRLVVSFALCFLGGIIAAIANGVGMYLPGPFLFSVGIFLVRNEEPPLSLLFVSLASFFFVGFMGTLLFK